MKLKLVCLIFLFSLSLATSAYAVTASDLSAQIEAARREREALVVEQQKLQAELDKISQESQSLGTAVKSLDAAKKKISQDIRVTQSKISSTDLNIKLLEKNVGVAERQMSTHHMAIRNALRTISDYDSNPLILSVLASSNLSDFWRDQSHLMGLSDTLSDEVDNLRETKSTLLEEKKKKEEAKQEIVSLSRELTSQKQVVEESQRAKQKLLAETKNKEAEYQKLIQENLVRQKESEEDLSRLETELQITLDPTLVPSAKRGILSWPLDFVYITQKFGKTVGAAKLYASGSHNGVDFRASQGTPVKAMLSGVVEGVGNTDEQRGCYSYGRWVLIRHNNGLSSVYSHLSGSLVKKGDEVRTGQVIGYSGGTPRTFGAGYSTGPHLHVGLFASQGVEVRQFTTSKGCKNVFVPIALGANAYLDPLAYLPSL